MDKFNKGDRVSWNTSQGETSGKVTKKITRETNVGGFRAKASKEHPEYEVKSDKSGKRAIHKPESLRKKGDK